LSCPDKLRNGRSIGRITEHFTDYGLLQAGVKQTCELKVDGDRRVRRELADGRIPGGPRDGGNRDGTFGPIAVRIVSRHGLCRQKVLQGSPGELHISRIPGDKEG